MRISNRANRAAVAAAAVATAVITASFPQDSFAHSGTAEEQAACTPDVLSLCLFDIPNEDRIVACLNRKRDQLSPACRKVIAPQPTAKKRRKR
ncbi:hypothetical protein [Hyphomicrobium sp.]|uniref:hypothetical protein n=1 Tax=Hyphomicrobium sp. TaxID=82 RepID=UPI002B5E046D|nr:hypothetical protein [Hyphomicrobium sp.]HVZ03996.1 hypothetical protein [Hyphomicrobium sp.]